LINVRNGGKEAQRFRVYFMDYFIQANNEFVFKSPGHYSYSCAKWLSTDTPEMEVPAGATGQKQFTLTVPPKAEPGGHYAVIFFEQSATDGGQIRAKGRIGVVTLVTVPGPIVREGSIKSVQVRSSWLWPARKVPLLPRTKVHCRVVFYNSGNVHLTIKGKLTYSPTFGWGTGSVNLGEITVLPKTTRYLEADINSPPFLGSYKAKAEVSYGPSLDVFDTTKTKDGSFNIYPLSLLLILAILLAIIIVLIFLMRRRRRKRVAKRSKGDETKEEEEDTDDSGVQEMRESQREEGTGFETEREGESRLPRRADRKKAVAKGKSKPGKHRATNQGKHKADRVKKNEVGNWK
jgi:hypothetical protein